MIDTNFIVNERIEVERLSILEIHLGFSHFPPTKVRSRRSERYGMYFASGVSARRSRGGYTFHVYMGQGWSMDRGR